MDPYKGEEKSGYRVYPIEMINTIPEKDKRSAFYISDSKVLQISKRTESKMRSSFSQEVFDVYTIYCEYQDQTVKLVASNEKEKLSISTNRYLDLAKAGDRCQLVFKNPNEIIYFKIPLADEKNVEGK